MKLFVHQGRKWQATALAVAAVLLPSLSHAGQTVPADDIRQNLYGTCLVSDSEGFAVGDLGRVFHTSDGGQTFEIQETGTKQPFVSISCVDAKNIWIAGQAGQISRSLDGGKSWKKLNSGVDRQILSIQMVTAQVGMAVGDFGTLLRTEDGGETWAKVPVPTDIKLPEEAEGIVEPGDVVFYSVSFAGPDFVAVVGEFGVALVSTDGGKSFQFRQTGIETTLFGAYFTDSQRGWAVGMESVFISTTDGGLTWKREPVKSPPGFSLALYDVEVKGSTGWAVGNSGFLINSLDGGATWKLVDVPPQMGSYWFREVSVQPSGKGLVVGSTGIVITTDGAKYNSHRKQL